MESLKKLFAERARVYEQMKDRSREWEGMIERGEDIPEDQNVEFDKWNANYSRLDEQIQRLEKLEAIESRDDERIEKIEKPEERDEKREYLEAFNAYLEGGSRALDHNQIKILRSGFVSEKEGRAATASGTTTTTGGYTIPEDFSYEVEKFMEFEGPFAGNNGPARIWTSTTGADLPWPTVDDTANDSYLLAEAGDATTSATGVTFGVETLKAYKFNTGVIPVNDELIQDNFGGFLSLLAELLGSRQGRGKNTACTTGTGTSQPEGCTVGSTQGKYAASATAFTQEEMLDLIYSVNKAYRMNTRSVGFMMNPLIVAEVRKLDLSTSNYTQPLFQPSAQLGQPAQILGYQYWENGAMASAMTTGQKIMMFGDWSKFVIRNVAGFVVKRSDEIYFETGQVAFMGWSRFDSRVMNANALKYLDLT